MKLYFALRTAAQARADLMHADMIATNPAYATSVSRGQTQRWSVPAQDTDDKGIPLNTEWFIVSKTRSDPVLTPAERLLLKPGNWNPNTQIPPI